MLVAPYAGDGNDTGSLIVRQWEPNTAGWSEPLHTFKSASAYLTSLGEGRRGMWRVEYLDDDGVGGDSVQTVQLRQAILSPSFFIVCRLRTVSRLVCWV